MKYSIYCYYTLVELHLRSHHLLVFYFFFSYFYSPYSLKKNTLLLPISPNLVLHFLQPFLSLFAFLSFHYFLFYCYTSFIIFSFLYFDSSSSHFILYKFDMISPIQFMFFPTKKKKNCEYYFSLSISLFGFLFFLITLIKVGGGFFIIIIIKNMCFGIVFFKFPI